MAMRNRKLYPGQSTKGKYKSALRGKYYLSHPEKNLRGSKFILFKSKLEAMFIRYLDSNPDILKSLKRVKGLVRIGFAAETGLPDAEAARKCREKGLDLVVGNDVTRPDSGFGTTTNRVTFVTPDGRAQRLPLMSKLAVARRIVAFAERIASNG